MELVNLLLGTAVGAGVVAFLWEVAGVLAGLTSHVRRPAARR
jgi:hypothetical protein